MNVSLVLRVFTRAYAAFGTRPPRRSAVAASLLLLVVAGCVLPGPEENGELYHHNWWNYYTRGAYLLRQGKTEEAQADFERCLGLIPGAKFGNRRDMWRARTYGLHFVEGYFPNRELGVCLYERNDVSQAIRFLENSLQQEPSGRAKHYLNLARKKQLSSRAVPAPQLKIDQVETPVLTRQRACQLSGAAAGEGCIRYLSVQGRSEFIELAEPSRTFARRVELKAGTNLVTVVTEDLLGQRVTRSVLRIADWQPPRLLLKRAVAQGRDWLVEGVCRDEFGVAEIALDATVLFRQTAADSTADVPVSLRVPGSGGTLTVTDRAGNTLACPLSAGALAQVALAGPPSTGLAWNPRSERQSGGFQTDACLFAVNRFQGQPNASALAQMAAYARPSMRFAHAGLIPVLASSAPAPSGDRLRPSLSLRGCQPVTRVFAEDFYVDGTAADGGGLASVTVNGEDLLSQQDQGSLRTYFARRLPLDMGTNSFEIVAADRAGNRSTTALTVIRLCPEYLDDSFRLSVGVPPLVPAEAGAISMRVKRSMESELTRTPVRFRLLERNEGWDFVLREQGLSVSDLADPSAALRIGKMVPAEMLFMGKIFIESKGLTVYLKAVETGNGEVVFASDVYTPDPDLGLDDAVAGLVLKVEQGFPLITGEVLRCQNARVTLNVGSLDGTTANSRFLVVEAKDSESLASGHVCKTAGQAVQLQIDRIQQKTSTARIIPSAADAIVKEGYYVYTR